MPGELPSALRAFIERCLTSAIQVEVLLMLRRQRGRTWTPPEVSRALRIDADQAEAAMTHLVRVGLLSREDTGYRLNPTRSHDGSLVDALADFYPNYRVAVVSLIFSRPSGPVRDSSDAFRLRDED